MHFNSYIFNCYKKIKYPPPGGSPEGDRRKIQGKDVYQFMVAHPERNVK